MSLDSEDEILAQIRASRAKERGYSDFFGWPNDRDLEEWGVVSSLGDSLKADHEFFFSNLKSRGRKNDPPDCEALSPNGTRIAIEVTELVDGDAICAFKAGRVYDWAEWSRNKFLLTLADRISKKDGLYHNLIDSPYPGGYVLVVFTDEPALSRKLVNEFLQDHQLQKPSYIDRVFFILSYDPEIKRCPYFELNFND